MSSSYRILLSILVCSFLFGLVGNAAPSNPKKGKGAQLDSLVSTVLIHYQEQRYDDALLLIQEGYRIAGRSKKYEDSVSFLKYLEARCYLESENYDYNKAESILREHLRDYPFFSYYVAPDLADLLISKGQYDEAITILEKYREFETPQKRDYEWETRTSFLLALAYIHTNQRDKASSLLYPLLNPNNSIYESYEEFKGFIIELYYELVVAEDGNIIWNDKVSLEVLRLLCDFTSENDAVWNHNFTHQHGTVSMILGDFETARRDFEYCIENYTPEDRLYLPAYYIDLAGALSRLGYFQDAHHSLDNAQLLMGEIDDPVWIEWCTTQIPFQRATLYLDEGKNYNIAASILEDLLKNEDIDHTTRATYLYNLGQAYENQDTQSASMAYNEALKLFNETSGHSLFYAKTLNRLGVLMNNSGDYSSAIKYYELAIDIFRRLSRDYDYSYIQTLSNAAMCAFNAKQYGRSISWSAESRRIQKEYQLITNPQAWLVLLQNYELLGNEDDYNTLYEEYRIVSKRDPYQEIYFKEIEIDHLYAQGEVEKSMLLVSDLDSLYRSLPIDSYSEYGNGIEQRINRFLPDKATMVEYYSTVLSQVDSLDHYSRSILKSLGYRALNADDLESALFFLKLAYEPNGDDLDFLSTCYHVAYSLNDKPFCSHVRDDLTSLIKSQLKSVIGLTDAEKEYYWQAIKDLQDLLLSSREDANSDSMLYDFLLSSKSFLLRSNISLFNYIKESGNQDLIKLGEDLRNTKRLLSEGLYVLPPETIDSLKLREIDINRALVTSIQDFTVFDVYGNYTYKEVMRSLKNGEIAIEFIDYPNSEGNIEYAAFINKSGLDKPVFVKLCNEMDLINASKVEPQKLYDKDLPFSAQLFNLIWSPIWPYITPGHTVYISVSGYLNSLALEAIATPSGKYVDEVITLRRVTTTSVLCEKREYESYKNASIFGGILYDSKSTEITNGDFVYSDSGYLIDRATDQDISYLPATKIEAESIAGLLKKTNLPTSLYIGHSGTEENFKQLSGKDISILHIATHGFYKPKDKTRHIAFFNALNSDDAIVPLQRSGLLLAGCSDAWNGHVAFGKEDGVLTASEIADMDLSSTQLVVISACESGLGEVTDDGVAGLQRAFKNAGVQSIVMSLWKVDDKATELLMTEFYKNITVGKSFNEAFKASQNKLKGNTKYRNPYYWASFIILD